MVLPNTDIDGAVEVAERIRKAVADADWPDRQVTASFGVAALTITTPVYVADMIRRADEALYESKANGRNCVTAKLESPNVSA